MTHATDGMRRRDAIVLCATMICVGRWAAPVLSAPIQTAVEPAAMIAETQNTQNPATRSSRDPTIVWPLSRTVPTEPAETAVQPIPTNSKPAPAEPMARPPTQPTGLTATVTIIGDRAEQIRLVKDRSAVVRTS